MRHVSSQMFEIIRNCPNVLTAYAEDFLVHDMDMIRNAKKGERYFWAIRDSGSHLILMDGTERANAYINSVWRTWHDSIDYMAVIDITDTENRAYPAGTIRMTSYADLMNEINGVYI